MASRNDVLLKARKARQSAWLMALVSAAEKNRALRNIAQALVRERACLVRENRKDLKEAARHDYPGSLVDRLVLNDQRIEAMAECVKDTVRLKDPVGELMAEFRRPNGLLIRKVRVPIGVVGIIYESRPNVTSDCIGLCLKSGNAVILKGGKEARHSNRAIFQVCLDALKKSKLPSGAIQLIESADRAAVRELLALDRYVDMIVPRGGEGLIRFVAENSRIPVVKHYKGVCHTYVSARADLRMARKICLNAKLQRPGVCNAMETLLVDKKIAAKFLPGLADELIAAGVELRGDAAARAVLKGRNIKAATTKDWFEEYLDLILSVRLVNGVREAAGHINTYGSRHSDAIVTEDRKEAEVFFKTVDSACLYHNASTRFTDGYEFGFGAEVGISTDKLHVRGPMALEGLTTYNYQVCGKGQIRQP
jgi:glutamate-5-semialdehyde dehydrogenase